MRPRGREAIKVRLVVKSEAIKARLIVKSEAIKE